MKQESKDKDVLWKILYYSSKEWAGMYGFVCPGCDEVHTINTTWSFNGDFVKPTFSPSYKRSKRNSDYMCHSYIRDGRIEYLSDCTHKLAGQTVDLPPARKRFGAAG